MLDEKRWIFLFFFCCIRMLLRFDEGNAHLLPLMEPSFFPIESSSSTPHHSPAANSVMPRYLSTPVLLPWLDDTITRSPILNSPRCDTVEDKLVVDASAFIVFSDARSLQYRIVKSYTSNFIHIKAWFFVFFRTVAKIKLQVSFYIIIKFLFFCW